MSKVRARLLTALLITCLPVLAARAQQAASAQDSRQGASVETAGHILKREALPEQEASELAALSNAHEEGARKGASEFGAAKPFRDFLGREARAVEADEQNTQTGGGAQTGGSGQQTGQTGATPQFTPLTPGQKMRRALRSAFLDPTGYAVAAFTAGLTQLGEDDLPHKETDDKIADWGSRTARNFGRLATRRIFVGGIYPVIFKQDPRYERSPHKGFGRRTLHAISRVFVTRDDDGNLEPNWSRFAGTVTAHGIANLWEHSTPGHDRIGWDATLRRIPRSLAFDALNNIIFREFLPDLF